MTNAVNLASAAGTGFAFRNYIINGNFDFWQRGTATPSWGAPVTAYYYADRWVANSSGTGGNGSLSRQAFTVGQTDVPGEPPYFLRWQITSAASGQTSGSCWIEQRIEDVRCLAGKTATLSFYAKGTGTLPNIYATQVFGTGGSTLVALTLASNVVLNSGWTKYTYTFTYPSISGKTIGTGNYIGITFMVPLNSTYTFDLAQVQLEEGSVATPFERRPYGLELALCQRYYRKNGRNFGIWVAADKFRVIDYHPVPMRAAPTCAVIDTNGYYEWLNNTGYYGLTTSLVSNGANLFSVDLTYTSNPSRGRSYNDPALVDASVASYSAEL